MPLGAAIRRQRFEGRDAIPANPITRMQLWMGVVVVASSPWASVDARSLGLRLGEGKGLRSLGLTGWFWACLLLWFPSVFVYSALRPGLQPQRATAAPAVDAAPRQPQPTEPAAPREPAARGMRGAQAMAWGVLPTALGRRVGRAARIHAETSAESPSAVILSACA